MERGDLSFFPEIDSALPHAGEVAPLLGAGTACFVADIVPLAQWRRDAPAEGVFLDNVPAHF
jgi:hypothetical protein